MRKIGNDSFLLRSDTPTHFTDRNMRWKSNVSLTSSEHHLAKDIAYRETARLSSAELGKWQIEFTNIALAVECCLLRIGKFGGTTLRLQSSAPERPRFRPNPTAHSRDAKFRAFVRQNKVNRTH